MYVKRIPNRDSPPAILLRESYREDGKVKSRTLANISDWPAAKLATARGLSEATAAHSLGAVLGLGEVDEDELYAALDLLGRNQASVEKALAERRLKDGVRVLYDVTSSDLEGRRCELAQFGFKPRPSPRPAADRLRSLVHAGRLPGRR